MRQIKYTPSQGPPRPWVHVFTMSDCNNKVSSFTFTEPNPTQAQRSEMTFQ